MNRLMLIIVVTAGAFLAMSRAQDRQPGTLPPGPPPGPTWGTPVSINALFVQAHMIEGGQVLFSGPQEDEPDPNKVPPPSIIRKVDGKAVRAVGTDRKPLDLKELEKRLSVRAAVVVVHTQPPDLFFLKALNYRGVIFVVPKNLFAQMAKAAAGEPLLGMWAVMKAGEKGDAPTGDYWLIGQKKIALHRAGKPDGTMTYKSDAGAYPMTIDLTHDQGPARGKPLKGIYELDGLALKICYISPAAEEAEKAERPKQMGAKGTVTVVFGLTPP
jgi:uncharacterized protein (TIGR03067 family)